MYRLIPINKKNTVILPFNGNYNNLKFGKIEIKNVKIIKSYLQEKNIINISKDLINKLSLNIDTEYRLNITKSKIEFGPLLGILLGNKTLKYNSDYMEKYLDRFIDFEHILGSVVAFSIDTINYNEKTVHGLCYNYQKNKFEFKKSPLPDFIYRRNFTQGEYAINKLKTYSYLTNHNRITKDDFYLMLKSSKVKDTLPFTFDYSVKNLEKCIIKNVDLILKPLGLSRGRGMIIIERENNNFKVTNYILEKEINYFNREELNKYLESLELTNYLIQQYLELDVYNDCKFDIRVVVQKNINDKFKISGIEVRLSKEGELLTNYSLGGSIVTLEEALRERWDFKIYKHFIEKLSIETAEIIDEHIPSYELGLDIAITKDGKIYLIEANSLPSFKGFKEINMKTYLKIRKNPLIYGMNKVGF